MTLVAIDRGVNERTGKYLVNVRNTEAAGNIGGAGVLRQFDSKEEAKDYIKSVNETGVDKFEKLNTTDSVKYVRHEGDSFTLTSK